MDDSTNTALAVKETHYFWFHDISPFVREPEIMGEHIFPTVTRSHAGAKQGVLALSDPGMIDKLKNHPCLGKIAKSVTSEEYSKMLSKANPKLGDHSTSPSLASFKAKDLEEITKHHVEQAKIAAEQKAISEVVDAASSTAKPNTKKTSLLSFAEIPKEKGK